MSNKFTLEEWESCMKVLNALKDDPLDNPDNQSFKTLFTQIYKKVKKNNRSDLKATHQQEDLIILNNSHIAKEALHYENKITPENQINKLNRDKKCYACLSLYNEAHFFYHRLCPTCANEHYVNREVYLDLNNKNVIITGGRVKVGYATALRFLRSKANVMVTTRFPALAWKQFNKELDVDEWKDQLFIYGLDLRNLKQIDAFVLFYKQEYNHLDILINNAAQTIKYTDEYYQPLIKNEDTLLESITNKKLIANTTSVGDQDLVLLEGGVARNEMTLNRFG